MRELLIAILIFSSLVAASLGSLLTYDKVPHSYREDETHNVVRQLTSFFVVMTSLVLGLMINSAKNAFEEVDHNVHAFATAMILLDRGLRQYGPEADDTRHRLLLYVQRAADGKWTSNDPLLVADRTSEQLLTDVGDSLGAIKPRDDRHAALLHGAGQQFQKAVELRWTLVEQGESAIPMPIIAMLVAWLVLIFASMGFKAPRNRVVAASLILSAALIAGAIYPILDMDAPFSGPIQVSPAPLERAIAELQR